MAKIIMFGNMKGGIGKSTVTVLAATALSQSPFNKKILVLDMDRQQSVTELRELDADDISEFSYQIQPCSVSEFYDNLQDLETQFDYIFLDVGGKLDNNLPFDKQEISPILLNTDILLVPFVAGNFGTEATIKYLEFVAKIQSVKKSKGQQLAVIGFVNMHIKNQKEDRQLTEYLDEIAAETGLKFMRNKLGFYTAYRGCNTIETLYSEQAATSQERNFKNWIKELEKTIDNV